MIEERRPLIWADDDITRELTRGERDAMALMGPVCFVSPDQTTGLIPRHLREIRVFLHRWSAIEEEK